MNIGIIIYSVSGHTLSVAAELEKKLSVAGHTVTLERLETEGPPTLRSESAPLKTKPAVASYDGLVFAAPVRGGVPASPMTRYLEQIPSLQGKPVDCLVTGFFPVAGWGRDQTIAQMCEICESRGATVRGSGSVGWFGLGRGRRIAQLVDSLSALF